MVVSIEITSDTRKSYDRKVEGDFASLCIGQEIACHFSQDHTMIKTIFDFIHKHLN